MPRDEARRQQSGKHQAEKACPSRTHPIARFSPSSNGFAFPFHYGRPEKILAIST